MNLPDLITEIDAEIARLQHVRSLLSGSNSTGAPKRKHTMSAGARARISAAQKKRWRERKRAGKR